MDKPGPTNESCTSFFDYLKEKNLRYDVNVVENFLLSLKAKQFLILSGCSGTGKTKIAQAYGKYITNNRNISRIIELGTTVNKADTRKMLSLQNSKKLFSELGTDVLEYKKEYSFTIGSVRAKGELDFVPRIAVTDNLEELKKEIKRKRGNS